MPKTDAKAESEIAGAVRENGPRNHRSPLAENHYRTINELLNWASDDVTIAVCNGRINREMIRNWRRGLARPAPWVVDAITTQIEHQARAALDLANRARASAGPGKGWNKGAKSLAIWRERKAKEKAASEAAESQPDYEQRNKSNRDPRAR